MDPDRMASFRSERSFRKSKCVEIALRPYIRLLSAVERSFPREPGWSAARSPLIVAETSRRSAGRCIPQVRETSVCNRYAIIPLLLRNCRTGDH